MIQHDELLRCIYFVYYFWRNKLYRNLSEDLFKRGRKKRILGFSFWNGSKKAYNMDAKCLKNWNFGVIITSECNFNNVLYDLLSLRYLLSERLNQCLITSTMLSQTDKARTATYWSSTHLVAQILNKITGFLS